MELYGSAAVGLHTMWNEHFGIGVVEMMAAGVPSIAHASGGPALDIIDAGRTGMLATTADEYSEALAALLYAPDAAVTRQRIARQARESVRERFSQEQFAATFVANMRRVLLRCRFG
uniref:Glycosyl transferase family 1 domain-containing protein n=2 Tax=Chrysotila carterae TaxID=13221 RepID=A0A7S4EZ33_CHRCT